MVQDEVETMEGRRKSMVLLLEWDGGWTALQ